ncbi:MAG: bifunctional diaminohydroxyphosphoribosylaminopyrimidine deaminase/5-amino-6-(5-phosphoribosylamino)uracil reductase RibD [Actinobacteria bacterium]|nr:bifunctional diaminohydroxyphosphoribosylaminopyrimidine deaminase/5-amino-6-(5-phosphoribosylamino)uracil reductase RibD [Actinomycetota bacterium]
MSSDQTFMARAVDLALGPSFTYPNPRVGAVLVRNGEIVSEGAHRGSGTPHAEAEALLGVDARSATMYVTLEPCAHHGRTPPCAPAVVDAGVSRVVAAMEDPDARTRGRGLAYLRAHGVDVTIGVLEDDARALNREWAHQRVTGRPWVTLKLALSLDGRLAAPDGSARWITGQGARRDVHARRRVSDAVMVGAGTVLADDPSLRVNDVTPTRRQPATIVVDAAGRVRPTARLFANHDVVMATTESVSPDARVGWAEAGADVLVLPSFEEGVDLAALLDVLGGGQGARRDWVELVCEGGAELATSLLSRRLVDLLELHHGPVLLGAGGPSIGRVGVASMSEALRWTCEEVRRTGDDVIATYRPPG